MALALESQESCYSCYICLEIFTDPVSTPCGHNFCKSCITRHWSGLGPYECPVCRETFTMQPQLKINTFVSTMVSQFRSQAQNKEELTEIFCDFCIDHKMKAARFCRDCASSYCEAHLQPHYTVAGLKRHQLQDIGAPLEQRSPPKPTKNPDIYNYSTYTVTNRKIHDRLGKIQEIKTTMEQNQKAANRKAKDVVQVFNSVVQEVQKSLDEFTEVIEEMQKKTEQQAQDMIQELEKEIQELQRKDAEDHLIFITHPANNKAPVVKEWDKVFIDLPVYDNSVAKVVSQLEEKISDKLKTLVVNSDLKRIQNFAVNLTLDPKTAHPKLVLSFDEKAVHHSDGKKRVSDNSERFTKCFNVMTRQSFPSGRFYFEVQVKGKTDWDVGVAKKSVNRKKKITQSPANGFWMICLQEGSKYSALENSPVLLPVKRGLQKVGVFMDYNLGVVSFYDADTGALLYSFTGCTFKDKLLPIFSPGLSEGVHNAAPLILTPVRPFRETSALELPKSERPTLNNHEPLYYNFEESRARRK